MENIPVDGELDRNSHHGENGGSPGPSTVVTNSDDQPITPGKMNQHQGKEAYFTPTKELLQPCLSPGTAHSHADSRSTVFVSLGSNTALGVPDCHACSGFLVLSVQEALTKQQCISS